MKLRSTENFRGRGFTLVELMVSVVLTGIIVGGLYQFLGKQRRHASTQRLKADLESLAQISFFIVGRDIRRAGSNPKGGLGNPVGQGIPLAQAHADKIEIVADLNGDGVVDADPVVAGEERIIYEFVDDPADADTVKDQIRRQAGNQLVIENVRLFDLKYQLTGTDTWVSEPADLPLIRKVRLRMVAGTGRINPNTGQEDTKDVQMDILLRNFR